MTIINEGLRQKWAPVMETEVMQARALSKGDVTIRMLENQETWCKSNHQFLAETGAASNATGAAVATWSPVLIKMVKRMVPNLIAHDLMGVQPLSTPDGLVFAMRARYASQTGAEAFYNEPQAGFSGGVAAAGDSSGFAKGFFNNTVGSENPAVDPVAGSGMTTAEAESLGADGGKAWAKMAVSIEKTSVAAKSRGLYADYSHELRQDMQAVHGEDVDTILSDMLSTEIQAEMNREFIRTVNIAAKLGAQNATKKGLFDVDVDADGRWFLEKLKGLLFQIEMEANAIALDTRRGKGNRVVCSPNVASALAMAGMLDFTPALAQNATMEVDPTGQTFAGVLSNGMKVFIDPYTMVEYATIGYKGDSALDAGIYFAPLNVAA